MNKIGKMRVCPTGRIAVEFLLILGFALICPGRAEAALRTGSICVNLYSEEKGISATDGVLTLYQVAVPSSDDGDMIYSFTPAFKDCGVSIQDVSDPALALALAGWVEKKAVAGTDAAVDSSGNVCFSGLVPGLYLIAQSSPSTGFYAIDAFLVSVPYQVGDEWVYDVDASPKAEIFWEPVNETPTEPGTGAVGTTLPQTGPLGWPLFLLTGGGILCFAGGIRAYQK